MSRPPDLLLAGEIGKPHGTAGEVYVVPISDDPQRFATGSQLIHADGRKLTVETARPHRDRFLVKFEGADSRSAADDLRGALYVRPTDLRALDAGEFWEHELAGCMVALPDGSHVGTVERVVHGPAQDLLAIATARGERLVPVVAEIVLTVDPDARRIVIDPPAGLLD